MDSPVALRRNPTKLIRLDGERSGSKYLVRIIDRIDDYVAQVGRGEIGELAAGLAKKTVLHEGAVEIISGDGTLEVDRRGYGCLGFAIAGSGSVEGNERGILGGQRCSTKQDQCWKRETSR